MGDDPKPADEVLAMVQRVLDRLTERGRHAAAFDIARAQFAASVRASWPANLSGIANAIDAVLKDPDLALDAEDRAELGRALDVLRSAPHP
jgi:hypothetical protein